MDKIAIYGGTFNPIHIGHLLTASDVLEQTDYKKIIFIPTNIPPHKDLPENILPKDRLKMVELSIQYTKNFYFDDIEIKKGGKSYTYNTLLYLQEKYKNSKIGFIIGDDLVPELDTWKNIDLLQNMCDFLCLRRKDIKNETKYRLTPINNRIISIESTEIRERVKKNIPITFMVTKEVENYIYENKLYIDKN